MLCPGTGSSCLLHVLYRNTLHNHADEIYTCDAGCCFLLGGAKHKHQKFNTMLNKACCSLLLLACIGLVIPTAANIFFPDTAGNGELPPTPRITTHGIANMSHATSLILGFV